MKKYCISMLRSIFFIIVSVTSINLEAQIDFRTGFILVEKDTIFGLINYRDDVYLQSECQFKPFDEAEIAYHYPSDISGFGFVDQKLFVSGKVNDQNIFLKALVLGELNLYVIKDLTDQRFFLENEALGLNEIVYVETLVRENLQDYVKVSNKYKGLLNAYLGNDPSFKDQINNINKPTENELIGLVRKYHQTKDITIQYPRVIRAKNQIAFEVNLGSIKYFSVENLDEETGFALGLIGHFGMARISEKLFLRTGLVFGSVNYPGKDRNVIKIPVQLEYRYPAGRLRPRLAYGMSFYSPFAASASLTAGLDLVTDSQIDITLNYDLDFNANGSFPLLPKGKLSNLFSLGIRMNFGQ